MAEYINREVLKNDIAKSTEPFNTGSVFRAINRQVAADVVPVVHGRWVEYQIPHIICCSNCDWATGTEEKNFQYCPNCGAKMDGGTD